MNATLTGTAHCLTGPATDDDTRLKPACDWTTQGDPAQVDRDADKHTKQLGHSTITNTTGATS